MGSCKYSVGRTRSWRKRGFDVPISPLQKAAFIALLAVGNRHLLVYHLWWQHAERDLVKYPSRY